MTDHPTPHPADLSHTSLRGLAEAYESAVGALADVAAALSRDSLTSRERQDWADAQLREGLLTVGEYVELTKFADQDRDAR